MHALRGEFILRKVDKAYWDELQARLRAKKLTERFLDRITLEKRRAYGVATRNFAGLLHAILLPARGYKPTSPGAPDLDTVNLKDIGGYQVTTAVRGCIDTIVESDYYYSLFNALIQTGNTIGVKLGCFFALGNGTKKESPDDVDLESRLFDIPASELREIDNPDNTVLSLTGSTTAESQVSISEMGLFFETLELVVKDYNIPQTIRILLDRATFSPMTFYAGDPIAVQYKVSLA